MSRCISTLCMAVSLVSMNMQLTAGWNPNWDLHFSKLNWTRTYVTVPCKDDSGISQRTVYEAEVRKFFEDPEFKEQVLKSDVEGLYIKGQALVHGYHDEIVDGCLHGRPRLLTQADQELLDTLKKLFSKGDFLDAYHKLRENRRGVQSAQDKLDEIDQYIQRNISDIAKTPKMVTVCFLLLGLAYYAFTYHASEIKEIAQEAKEGVQQGAHIAGDAISHALEKPKPESKPETNPDEKKS